MSDLELRAKNVNATQSKFGAKPFKWGGCDCAKMLAFHLRKFGHKVPRATGYRSALTAKKKLLSLGYETLPALIDGIGLQNIAPASALLGDVVSFACDDPLGGVGIVHGNGNMMCFHEDHLTPVIMSMDQIDQAWRVI